MVVSLLLTGTLKVPTLPIHNHENGNPMPKNEFAPAASQPWDDPTCSLKFYRRLMLVRVWVRLADSCSICCWLSGWKSGIIAQGSIEEGSVSLHHHTSIELRDYLEDKAKNSHDTVLFEHVLGKGLSSPPCKRQRLLFIHAVPAGL